MPPKSHIEKKPQWCILINQTHLTDTETACIILLLRSVAQSGSAPGLGPGGPRFESLYSDQNLKSPFDGNIERGFFYARRILFPALAPRRRFVLHALNRRAKLQAGQPTPPHR